MALHELATNASKYGALSNATGPVSVRRRIDGDALALSSYARDQQPEIYRDTPFVQKPAELDDPVARVRGELERVR